MAYRIKLDGTTKDVFDIGLHKGVLDFSALTTQRTLKFPDSNGASGYVLTTDGAGNLTWAAGGGGSTSPAGADTQVQFNNAGAFGATSNFTAARVPATGPGYYTVTIGGTDGGRLKLLDSSSEVLTLANYGYGGTTLENTVGILTVQGASSLILKSSGYLHLDTPYIKVHHGTSGEVIRLTDTGNVSLKGNLNLYGTASEVQVNGSAGTAGQVLTSGGAGAAVTWTTPAAAPFTGTRIGSVSVTTGTTSVNVSGYDTINLSMGADTLLNLSGGTDGLRLVLNFTQDGTGSRLVTLGTMFQFGTDITSFTLSTAVGTTDKLGVIYNATSGKFQVVAYSKGF
jgi:hypothetical protein